MSDAERALSIGDLAAATGVAPGTLRMWEARHDFPRATRGGGGHRRYATEDVERVTRVLEDRRRGLSLPAAIERVRRWTPAAPPSLYTALREHQPGLEARRLPAAAMLAVTRAIEDECLARAARPVLAGTFQREIHFRRAEARWRELARTARLAFVLADFPARRAPRGGPVEIPIGGGHPVIREWAVVCVDERLTACLTGWEQPGLDGRRAFEAIWTTDPGAVTATLEAAIALAGPQIAERAADALLHVGPLPAADPATVTALANRMVAYLAEDPWRTTRP
jgi:DNA-binding transcriptional MerR regulator